MILNVSSRYAKPELVKNEKRRAEILSLQKVDEVALYPHIFLQKYINEEDFFEPRWPLKIYSLSKLLLNLYTKIYSQKEKVKQKNI